MAQSKLRPLRVPDDPYKAACARAAREGTSIGRVTTALLARYAAGEIDVEVDQ